MASPNTSIRDKGFTLVEILVVIALFSIILWFGLFVGFDFYKNYSFRSEESVIVSVLQKARNQSLNNINQTRHGVHFEQGQYIIFECPTATPQCDAYSAGPEDNTINSSYGISIDNLPFDVIFEQLGGNCANCPITIKASYENNDYEIEINSEGGISW